MHIGVFNKNNTYQKIKKTKYLVDRKNSCKFAKYKKENKMTKEELENYKPKGELEGFPKEIIARMLDCQEEQGNKRDVTVFEKYNSCSLVAGGFDWDETKEEDFFWYEVICNKDFNLFFEKYPKKEDNQEFRVEDKVIDIIRGVRGKVTCIDTLPKNRYPIFVEFNDNETAGFTLDGRYYSDDKYPRLLHYRDDYDYSVIDFNNLPKRQKANRWRAEVGEKYYYLDIYFEVHSFLEEYSNTDTKLYKIGNYFQTKEQAQEVANKLNKYFNELINK